MAPRVSFPLTVVPAALGPYQETHFAFYQEFSLKMVNNNSIELTGWLDQSSPNLLVDPIGILLEQWFLLTYLVLQKSK